MNSVAAEFHDWNYCEIIVSSGSSWLCVGRLFGEMAFWVCALEDEEELIDEQEDGEGNSTEEGAAEDTPTCESTGNIQGSPKATGVEFRGRVCSPRRGWGFQMPGLGFLYRPQGEAVEWELVGKVFKSRSDLWNQSGHRCERQEASAVLLTGEDRALCESGAAAEGETEAWAPEGA